MNIKSILRSNLFLMCFLPTGNTIYCSLRLRCAYSTGVILGVLKFSINVSLLLLLGHEQMTTWIL